MLVRLGVSRLRSSAGIHQESAIIHRFLNCSSPIPSFSALSSSVGSRTAIAQQKNFTTIISNSPQTKSSAFDGGKLAFFNKSRRAGFSSKAEVYEFQAETRKLLDIVARSLYTDKEVFIRELISNASDALEKFRQLSMTSVKINEPEIPPEISIETNEKDNTISIQDTGKGMKKDDLIKYLGTIARSGSAEFMKQVTDSANATNIIGQFGVGFYSTFMVGTRVRVYTKHAEEGSKGYLWTSDGSGSFEIDDYDGLIRGTKIVIELKEDTREFSLEAEVEKIVKKYSNFVGYTIKLNQKEINTVKAIWMLPKDKISEDDHKAFYNFITHAFDTPTYRLHYSTDTPVSINSIFYFPSQHTEKYNLGRMEPGVSLYSRKVLIQSHTKLLLPDWLRFVKGVVDSADIPLNLSREHLQDSALIRRLDNVLTRRILKYLSDQMKEDRTKYEQWWKEFGTFLKEGLCVDFKWKEELGRLLLVESSGLGAGELTSLEEYISRMSPDQKEIYWLCVPNRTIAETSPYYEAFKQKGIEVLFLHTSMDDFVMNNLVEYNGKKLVSIESAALEGEKEDSDIIKSEESITGLRQWITDVLSDRVAAVKTSTRLVSSPALIVDHESANFRRMMKFVDPSRAPQLPKQTLEINPKHPIILNLNKVRNEDSNLAKLVVEQLFDNALIAAGLLDDPRSMISRINDLMNTALEKTDRRD